ncbi:MAG: hypothetical protein Q7U04_05855 [Bacteriovorax sp.]|nr:hypothetical protein [Bacteriovorax sp.]
MKITLLLGILTSMISFSAFAKIAQSFDAEKSCVLYRVAPADESGKVILQEGEVIIYDKDAYGISLTDMEIDFAKHEVLVQPTINVIFGFNRALIEGKASIAANNPEFNFLINQLNRKLYVFEKICIYEGFIIYANMFETKPVLQK